MAFEKYTKEECDYGQGEWPRECGTCAHYINYPTRSGYEKHGSCKIVQGRIGDHDLCKFHVYAKGKEGLEHQEGGEPVSGSPDLYKTYDLGKDPRFEKFVRGYIGRVEGRRGTEGWCDICNQYVESTHRH